MSHRTALLLSAVLPRWVWPGAPPGPDQLLPAAPAVSDIRRVIDTLFMQDSGVGVCVCTRCFLWCSGMRRKSREKRGWVFCSPVRLLLSSCTGRHVTPDTPTVPHTCYCIITLYLMQTTIIMLYHYTLTIRLTLAWSRVVGKLSSIHELPLGRHLGGDRISVMDQSDLAGVKVI